MGDRSSIWNENNKQALGSKGMEIKEYVEQALRTESRIDEIKVDPRLLHGSLGISTEAGELLDALKKHIYYGKPLDTVNMKEELGDICWYLAILCDALGADPREILETNIAKLRARYPNKFESNKALNRDLEVERNILEGK